MQHQESIEFVQHMNEEGKLVVCVELVVWHFEKFCVLVDTTQRKITKQVRKNSILCPDI
jgi:hypothetical protein